VSSELFTRATNIVLIKKGNGLCLEKGDKVHIQTKSKQRFKSKEVNPCTDSSPPGRPQLELSVDLGACSWADLGQVTIASVTCSCSFARVSWTGPLSVCLSVIQIRATGRFLANHPCDIHMASQGWFGFFVLIYFCFLQLSYAKTMG